MPSTLEEALKMITTLQGQVSELNATIATKDGIIAEKTKDLVGIRKKYAPYIKLSEMSEEDKAKLTPEERKQKEEMDLIVENQEAQAKEAQELRAREIAERKNSVVQKLAGKDPAIAEKVLKNFDLIKGSDAAYTEAEIAQFMGMAVNMLGDERPNPLGAALNGGGGMPPQPAAPVDEQKTKDLAASMGLGDVFTTPTPPAPPAPPTPPAPTV